MSNKPAYTVANQILLLKQRGMLFNDEVEATLFLKNISYYRLKGYWWDMQQDYNLHILKPNTFFDDVKLRYTFDRDLRVILFEMIDSIEVSLRTKLIYHLSLNYGGLWYTNTKLFANSSIHSNTLEKLRKEFDRSLEIFIMDQKRRHPNSDADVWKILEIASIGTLSKLYKNLNHQLPEKSLIAKEMGLNLHSELSSWLEAITYVRNIIAHHSRMWNRNMVKHPISNLNNPIGKWFQSPLSRVQTQKPFLIISCMLFLCNTVEPENNIQQKLLELFKKYSKVPIYKLGFLNNWQNQPIWNPNVTI